MVALSALGMPATADPSTLAGVALRSTFPSCTSWRMTTAENVLVMLPIPNNMSGRIGAPDWRSAFPATPVQTIPLRVAMAAEMPGMPWATALSNSPCSWDAASMAAPFPPPRRAHADMTSKPTSTGNARVFTGTCRIRGAQSSGRPHSRKGKRQHGTGHGGTAALSMRAPQTTRHPSNGLIR